MSTQCAPLPKVNTLVSDSGTSSELQESHDASKGSLTAYFLSLRSSAPTPSPNLLQLILGFRFSAFPVTETTYLETIKNIVASHVISSIWELAHWIGVAMIVFWHRPNSFFHVHPRGTEIAFLIFSLICLLPRIILFVKNEEVNLLLEMGHHVVRRTAKFAKRMVKWRSAVVLCELPSLTYIILTRGGDTKFQECLLVDAALIMSTIMLIIGLRFRYRRWVKPLAVYTTNRTEADIRKWTEDLNGILEKVNAHLRV